jgi:hypothetical protein
VLDGSIWPSPSPISNVRPIARLRYAPALFAGSAQVRRSCRWVMLHVQSNPLPICTRPRVLIKGKRT